MNEYSNTKNDPADFLALAVVALLAYQLFTGKLSLFD